MTLWRGERIADLLLLTDADGRRHAIRIHAIQGVHEGEPEDDDTTISLPAGRVLRVGHSFEHVLAWLLGPTRSTRTGGRS